MMFSSVNAGKARTSSLWGGRISSVLSKAGAVGSAYVAGTMDKVSTYAVRVAKCPCLLNFHHHLAHIAEDQRACGGM
jgi:hypothetical protein